MFAYGQGAPRGVDPVLCETPAMRTRVAIGLAEYGALLEVSAVANGPAEIVSAGQNVRELRPSP